MAFDPSACLLWLVTPSVRGFPPFLFLYLLILLAAFHYCCYGITLWKMFVLKRQAQLEILDFQNSTCEEPEQRTHFLDRSNTLALRGVRRELSKYLANLAFIKFGASESEDSSVRRANDLILRKYLSKMASIYLEGKNVGLKPRDIAVVIEDACLLARVMPKSDLALGALRGR